MSRLTWKKPNGEWGLANGSLQDIPREYYGCMCKLKDYEETGLNPEQVERLKEMCPPCRIGQDAWYIRRYNGLEVIRQGVISELYYRADMILIAVVKNIGRGIVGETVFLDHEAAEKAKVGAQ